MVEDFPDEFGVLNGGDNSDLAVTVWAKGNVEVEYPLKEPGPRDTFGNCGLFFTTLNYIELGVVLWLGYDLLPVLVVWRKNSVKSCEMHSGPRHEGRQSFHKFHRREFDGGGSVVPRFFESVDDFTANVGGEPLLGDGRACDISADFFEFFALIDVTGDAGVETKPGVFGDQSPFGVVVTIGEGFEHHGFFAL